nr:Hypothetical protein [synthetic construct]
MKDAPATPTGGQEQEGRGAPLLACLAQYRAAADHLRRSLEARAAREELAVWRVLAAPSL